MISYYHRQNIIKYTLIIYKIFIFIIIIINEIFFKPNILLKRKYITLNNKIFIINNFKCNNNKILLLIPHCLQALKCNIRITNNINNCKKCGNCQISNIYHITNKYNIICKIATGGSIARQIIKESNPKFIIAVACENDLFSGLRDIKRIPVYCIINERPNGPCIETKINLNQIKEIIISLSPRS